MLGAADKLVEKGSSLCRRRLMQFVGTIKHFDSIVETKLEFQATGLNLLFQTWSICKNLVNKHEGWQLVVGYLEKDCGFNS